MLLVERQNSLDYEKFSVMINFLLKCSSASTKPIDKSTVQKLLGIAQSDHERQCIHFASGITPTQARKQFGFENMNEKAQHVEACIYSVRVIREAIDDLAKTQDEGLLGSFGITPDDATISSDSESSLCSLSEGEEFGRAPEEDTLEIEEFKQIVSNCHFNWFNIVESCPHVSEKALAATLTNALDNNLDLESSKITLLLQSRDAYHNVAFDAYESDRIARAVKERL